MKFYLCLLLFILILIFSHTFKQDQRTSYNKKFSELVVPGRNHTVCNPLGGGLCFKNLCMTIDPVHSSTLLWVSPKEICCFTLFLTKCREEELE